MIPLFKVFMDKKAHKAVKRVMRSGYVAEGPEVDAFETELQQFLGCARRPLATSSCTAALDLALHLAGVEPGDEVISTPMTCTATNSVIVNRGAKIVWADINPVTGLISPESVAARLTCKTAAIMAVDWAGLPCDYRALKALGVPVIEDAAHAVASLVLDPQGDLQSVADGGGHYVCFSFQAIKHLSTGDGGALVCPPEQYERARKLRWFGLDRTSPADFRAKQRITESGYKYHMNDIAAAIGRANLDRLHKRVDAHHWSATRLWDGIYSDNEWGGWGVPDAPSLCSSSWFYQLHVHHRDQFIEHMADCGVQVSQVHARNDRHPIFPEAPDSEYPGLAQFSATQIALPCGWWLDAEDIERIVGAVRSWLK